MTSYQDVIVFVCIVIEIW